MDTPENHLNISVDEFYRRNMSVSVRAHLSVTHFKNARIFRDKAKRIEAIYNNEPSSEVPQIDKEEHKAYCMNSIIGSVTFLESFAKEFAADLEDDQNRVDNGKDPQHVPEIDASHRQAIVNEPNLSNRLDNASPPIKYNVYLDIIGENEFDRSSDPLEPALVLTQLRNELVHYTPQWLEGGAPKDYTEDEYGFEEDLRGRFDLNPLMPSGNPFFPDQCLSYGCAEWALRYARALVYHFSNRVDFELHPEIHS